MDWKEKLAKVWYKTKLADTSLQIAKDARRQAVVERLIKKTQEGTLNQQTKEPMDGILEEDMGISVGNETYETHNHYHTVPPQQPSAIQEQQKTKDNSLFKTLAGAGILAAGLGIGATPLLLYLSRDKGQQQQQEFIDTDTDTRMGIRVYRPEVNGTQPNRNSNSN